MNITVIGLGRLGTAAASGLAAAGHEVTGLDIKGATVKAFGPKAGAAACEALPSSVEFVGAAAGNCSGIGSEIPMDGPASP